MENDVKTQMRDQILQAAIPLMVEGLNLMTDAVRELREQLEWDRISRKETAPLEKKLKVLRLEAELEDFQAERSEKSSEREVAEQERLVRSARAAQELFRLNEKRRDLEADTDDHVGGVVKINGLDY